MASFTIIHFNDVYNIEGQPDEPVGGAARLAAYVKSCGHLNPLVLFSGDALNPSLMSIFLKGEQMIPILNGIGVQCAVFGNHDFDFGVDHLVEFIEQTTFPWLLSNIVDNVNEEPLGKGEITYIVERNGVKVGLIGIVEEEWIATLSTVDTEDITFLDFVQQSQRLALQLRQQGADIVIALTHMRWPNDEKLAECVPEIDLILGGHDHDYDVKQVNGRYVLKSGTDFRNCSKLTLTRDDTGWFIDIQRVDLTSDFPEDPDVKLVVQKMLEGVEGKMDTYLGTMGVQMDGRFSSVRTMETNLGNFITDIMLSATNAEIGLLNSGTLRSDRLHPKGEFCIRDLLMILPFPDPLLVIEVSGIQLLQALENGVSQYPRKEGRFPQVAGVSFGFNPTKPPGQRVSLETVRVQGQPVVLDQRTYSCMEKYAYPSVCYCVPEFAVTLAVLVSMCDRVSRQCLKRSARVIVHVMVSVQFDDVIVNELCTCLRKTNWYVDRAWITLTSPADWFVRRASMTQRLRAPFCVPHVEGRIFITSDESVKAMAEIIPASVLHHNLSIIQESALLSSTESLDKV
ncbi:mannosylglucosyl-3-phosphoglycerate phosphatase-like [Babylonia areolata]|uniref:mannosylglucosyl-3-phosphoglycerate phosphatase-like n=1 Tax=Babylonia areolata TaxID=304850 RepID=UPI003FD0A722